MEIITVGVSHETAPVAVRERISFTKKKQAELLRYIKQNIAKECVILSTCNRCEFYIAGGSGDKLTEYIKSLTDDCVMKYLRVLKNDDCAEHLMLTAAGLRSMILGEDQILGQVKDAHETAMKNDACGPYLNTLFRLAVTGAKRVKTDTLLSKTPVSAATVAIKLCRETLGALDGKNVLVIGASGKTGSIVLKDLTSVKNVNLYATSRRHGESVNKIDGAVNVDYDKRYDILDICDAVISATSSPHFTLEKGKTAAALVTRKKRLFIDLAVPRDMDIAEDEYNIYKNIDDLKEIANRNNEIKLTETEKAKRILKSYCDEFRVWRLFYDNRRVFDRAEDRIENESEKDHFRREIYRLKSENNYMKLYDFVLSLKEEAHEY